MNRIQVLSLCLTLLSLDAAGRTSAQNVPGLLAAPISSDGPITEGFQFSLSLTRHQFQADQPVYLDVALKNVTDKALTQLYPNPIVAATMNIIVQTPDGKPVPLTAYGSERHSPVDFSVRYFSVASHVYRVPEVPGHGALKYHLLLSRLYDLSQYGEYVVIAKQLIPTLDGRGTAVVASRPLRFEINGDSSEPPPFLTNPAW